MIDFNNPPRVEGKTFSLFGDSESTDKYFTVVDALVSQILSIEPDINKVLQQLRDGQSLFKRITKSSNTRNQQLSLDEIYPELKSRLSVYTRNTAQHLKHLSLYKRLFDKRLDTSEKEYHLYMLEAELVNRLYKDEFNNCDRKIALLPHCLKDLSKKCKSESDNFDYECKGCSKECYINEISWLLREHNIHPYIWMEADLDKLLKKAAQHGNNSKAKSLGVLGIACIPELVSGMRRCIKAKAPVVGLPLNANRCGRWFGEFYPNSINISQLRDILK